jgi:23S rRNA (cytosine1962-C5)-methyltransferase
MKTIEARDALPTVRLKIERRSNHPWIFQKMVEKPEPKPRPGSIVDIEDRNGHGCGRGFYNGHSRIALRVLSERPTRPSTTTSSVASIGEALQLRRDILKLDAVTDAYRVVHSEGDGFSGTGGRSLRRHCWSSSTSRPACGSSAT